jgi:hypothetical protein
VDGGKEGKIGGDQESLMDLISSVGEVPEVESKQGVEVKKEVKMVTVKKDGVLVKVPVKKGKA